MNKVLMGILILLTFCYAKAQSDYVVGKEYSIPSNVFETNRKIWVSTPEDYQASNKSYPVLYLLDGQRWFLQAVSYQRLFSEYSYTPDFIVVGINTDDPQRYGFFANSEKLIDFIEKDVISSVDSLFRTSDERMLFGWQFAGAFCINTLVERPELFDAYFSASPIPLRESSYSELNSVNMPTSLFLTTSLNEHMVNEGVEKFTSFLKEKSFESLRWKYRMADMESISSFGHRTTPLSTLYQGLRFHFQDYPLLEFDRLEDFNNAGGHDYVNRYYEQRGEKYGISKEIPEEGMFFLVRLGLDSKDYSTFDRFMKDFIPRGFLETVNLGWGSNYADFYLENDDYEGAQLVYESLSTRFPNSARPINGLGDVFAKKGEIKKAKKYYKQAIELAEETSDRRITDYKKDLESLNKK